jgi:hypothetical protein
VSTLGGLKAEIADDLARSDLTTQIASAISHAIRVHRGRPFWWTRDRSTTFSTTASTAQYTSAEVAAFENVIRLHHVLVERNGSKSRLLWMRQDELEIANSGGSESYPAFYSWHDGALWLSPVPDAAYTVQLFADMIEAAPATDAETGNRWMTDCYGLIRAEAKRYLAKHVMRDRSLDEDMQQDVVRELRNLMQESARKDTSGTIAVDEDYSNRSTPYWHGSYGRRW